MEREIGQFENLNYERAGIAVAPTYFNVRAPRRLTNYQLIFKVRRAISEAAEPVIVLDESDQTDFAAETRQANINDLMKIVPPKVADLYIKN